MGGADPYQASSSRLENPLTDWMMKRLPASLALVPPFQRTRPGSDRSVVLWSGWTPTSSEEEMPPRHHQRNLTPKKRLTTKCWWGRRAGMRQRLDSQQCGQNFA